jgi:hypothetical protein
MDGFPHRLSDRHKTWTNCWCYFIQTLQKWSVTSIVVYNVAWRHDTVSSKLHGHNSVASKLHKHNFVTAILHGHNSVNFTLHGHISVNFTLCGHNSMTSKLHRDNKVTSKLHGHISLTSKTPHRYNSMNISWSEQLSEMDEGFLWFIESH